MVKAPKIAHCFRCKRVVPEIKALMTGPNPDGSGMKIDHLGSHDFVCPHCGQAIRIEIFGG